MPTSTDAASPDARRRAEPRDRSARMTVGISPDARQQLRIWCLQRHVTLEEYVLRAVDAELRREGAGFQVFETAD